MKTYKELLEEKLKDPEFKREWDAVQPEMDRIRKKIDERNKAEKGNEK